MPVLAQAVTAAANAAAQAAQAAASSGGAAGPGAEGAGGSQGVLKRDLAKLIPRPGTFNPTDREQEVLQWRDWYWTVKQYLVVVDAAFQDELEKLESNLTTEIDWELLDEGEQQRSRFLYSLLGSLVQGRLTGVIVQWHGSTSTTVDELSTSGEKQDDEPPARDNVVPELQHEEFLAASNPQAGGTLCSV